MAQRRSSSEVILQVGLISTCALLACDLVIATLLKVIGRIDSPSYFPGKNSS